MILPFDYEYPIPRSRGRFRVMLLAGRFFTRTDRARKKLGGSTQSVDLQYLRSGRIWVETVADVPCFI